MKSGNIIMSFSSEVDKLRKDPSPETKLDVTVRITEFFNGEMLDQKEKTLALEIIGLLAYDAEVHIRRTLAENLKNSTAIPHNLALKLAKDVPTVAVPILEFSSLLTQEDLIEIVRSTKEIAALDAIASRNDISQQLSGALIDTSHEKIIRTLINNQKADVSETQLRNVLNGFAASGHIIESMVNRGNLPVSIVQHMLDKVSDEIKKKLIQQYNVTENTAKDIVTATNEQTTLDMLSIADNEHIIQGLVDHLFETHKLTPSIVLRALCKGDFVFFSRGLAKLANVSPEYARKMLYTKNAVDFISLYKTANMPEGAFAAVNIIWKFALSELTSGRFDKVTYSNRLIEHITENNYDKKINIMEYFMILIKSKVTNDDAYL